MHIASIGTANLPSSLIGLEACAGAHFLGAELRQQGHEVRLIPGQFIKPTVSPTRTTSSMAKLSPRP